MMVIKIKKRKKVGRMRGSTTHGHGSRKKWKGSGHRGGKGMAGTGKRAGQKKTLILKKYGTGYFGKKGITSKKTAKKKNKIINLRDIEINYNSFKKLENDWLDLGEYKVLGDGELTKKIKIKVLGITSNAKEKIEKIGGEVSVLENREKTDYR